MSLEHVGQIIDFITGQVPKLAVVSYVSKNSYITICYSHIDTFIFESYLSMISMSVMTFVPGLC